MATDEAWAGETVELTGDVANATTVLADATGLSLTIPAAGLYAFRFWVVFQTSGTAVGILLSVNGPAQSLLAVTTNTPQSVSQVVHSAYRAYDGGAASGGTDAANSNFLALIDGMVQATASGTLIVRFAAEVAGTATVKAGSCGRIRRLDNP